LLSHLCSTSRITYESVWVMSGGANLPPDAMQAAQQTLEKCRLANFDELQRVWSLKTALSDSERQVARDQLGDCLRDRGVKGVPQHPASSDWERFIVVGSGMDLTSRQAFRECKAAVQDAFGLLTTEVPYSPMPWDLGAAAVFVGPIIALSALVASNNNRVGEAGSSPPLLASP